MLTEIMFHQGCKYAIRSDASKTIIQFILSNGGSSRKVYNLYVESLYNYLEKNGYVNGPIEGYKSPEVTEFKKRSSNRSPHFSASKWWVVHSYTNASPSASA